MIAGFIFLRLRGILGKRTGFEGKAPSQFEEVLNNIQAEKKIIQKENFDDKAQREFLEGAKVAYETIITDFSDNDNKLIASKPLLSKKIHDQFEEALKDSSFVRVHKSYLVNVNEIVKYKKGKGGSVVLSNEKEIMVSASKKANLLSYFK